MHPLVLLSILVLLVAAGWAVVLAVRPIERRIRFLAGAIALVTVGQLITVLREAFGPAPEPQHSHLWDLGVAAALLLTVYVLDRVIARQRRVTQAFASERVEVAQVVRRLEMAVESIQLGVSVTDVAGKIVYVNPADAAMHGYSRAGQLAFVALSHS